MPTPESPEVARSLMIHRWDLITFLHWRIPPATLRPMLPDGLTVETFDGSAWVGLTPFLMRGVRPPGLPAVPWLSRFPETNVRGYVRDRQGRPGIWFLSLDAARLPAVLAARIGYRLPYFWSDMRVDVGDGVSGGRRIGYRARRRWSRMGRPGHLVDVELGQPLPASEQDELADFLTARYRLFTTIRGRLASAEVQHEPWPLCQVELIRLEQDLLTAAGLPVSGRPVTVHASPGVPVRVGWWHH